MLQKPINRRTLLKALLTAGGGLIASAFLPAQWTKPLVKSGILPVHAQTSSTYYLTGGYQEWPEARISGTVRGIWAFVSSSTIQAPVRIPGQNRSPSSARSQSLLNGVGGISVTFSFERDNPPVVETVPVNPPQLRETISTGSDKGYIFFGDQELFGWDPADDIWLRLTAPQCINSPVDVP